MAQFRGVAIEIPSSWIAHEGANLLQILSPTGLTAITISVYPVIDKRAELDARWHLKRFLDSQKRTEINILYGEPKRASAGFNDEDGHRWRVLFVSTADRLVMATVNGTKEHPAEMKTAVDSLTNIVVS